jgi:hypothetical protein
VHCALTPAAFREILTVVANNENLPINGWKLPSTTALLNPNGFAATILPTDHSRKALQQNTRLLSFGTELEATIQIDNVVILRWIDLR